MTPMVEITPQTNVDAVKEFRTALGELIVSFNQLERALTNARACADAESIAVIATMMMQCMFGIRLLAVRVGCYERSVDSIEYSRQFWMNVVFN